jgi:hypothetical protein
MSSSSPEDINLLRAQLASTQAQAASLQNALDQRQPYYQNQEQRPPIPARVITQPQALGYTQNPRQLGYQGQVRGHGMELQEIISRQPVSPGGTVTITQEMLDAVQIDDDAEMLYQEGMKHYDEGERLSGINGGYSSGRAAYQRSFPYLGEARDKGHIGAGVKLEKYDQENWGGYYKQIEKKSTFCSKGCTECLGWTCMIVPPFQALLPFLLNCNTTTDDQIRETHAAYDEKMKMLSRWESITRDPILKTEIYKLKNNLLGARKKYDQTVSLCCDNETSMNCCCCCFNCTIRDASTMQ